MTRELDFAAAVSALASLPPGTEPCSECRVATLSELLVDCGDLGPFAGLCCSECESKLLSDLRDEFPGERELLAREATARGGLSEGANELFTRGDDWSGDARLVR